MSKVFEVLLGLCVYGKLLGPKRVDASEELISPESKACSEYFVIRVGK